MQPKFSPNQRVLADGRECRVVSMNYSNNQWSYTVSSVEWNPKTRSIVKGVEHHTEEELTAIEE